MKVKSGRKARSPRSHRRFKEKEFSLSNAKTFLGRLLDKAKRGEEVIIMRGSERFTLSEIKPIAPIPMRPPGYFKLDAEDIELERKFSKISVLPKKEDFE
jgi:hypothetical protein